MPRYQRSAACNKASPPGTEFAHEPGIRDRLRRRCRLQRGKTNANATSLPPKTLSTAPTTRYETDMLPAKPIESTRNRETFRLHRLYTPPGDRTNRIIVSRRLNSLSPKVLYIISCITHFPAFILAFILVNLIKHIFL